MRIFFTLLTLCMAAPLWAAPSLTDLDSWQLPEDEPTPVAKPAPAPKPTPKKTTSSKEPDLEVQLATGYGLASSTHDATEIAVMRQSAKNLQTRLAGKNRFYVLFNANIPTTSDKIIVAEDGKEYAVVLFGNEKQNYRLFLFRNGVEQPLVAVAENTAGKLDMYRNYKVNVGITETDFKNAYPNAAPQPITGTDQTVYQAYQFSGPLFVLFKDGKPFRQFTSEADFTAYAYQLQGIQPPTTDTGEQTPARSKWLQAEEKPAPAKRLFSQIVAEGTIWEKMYRSSGMEDEMDPWGPSPTRSSRNSRNNRRR